MPPIRRVLVELRPETRWLFDGGTQYRIRIQVDAGATQYAQDQYLTTDDFTSRFDWMIDHAKRTIRSVIERDTQQEARHVQVKEDSSDATCVHEED